MATAAAAQKGLSERIRSTLHEWKLVLQRVRKPDREEYIQTSKVIWLAVLVVGGVAYVIHLAAYLALRGG